VQVVVAGSAFIRQGRRVAQAKRVAMTDPYDNKMESSLLPSCKRHDSSADGDREVFSQHGKPAEQLFPAVVAIRRITYGDR
jgi:hypothetical protein